MTRLCLHLILLGILGLAAPAVQGQITENNRRLSLPNSHLHRSYEAPVFVTGHLGLGGGFQYDHGLVNYGGSFIFRPESAASFLDFLQPLNSAMVLSLDYQKLTPTNRLLSADLILRHYFDDRGDDTTEVLPFFGLGLGSTDVNFPAAEGGGNSRYWSLLAEVGQEWFFRPNVVVVARLQYRHYSFGEAFVTTWSLSGAVGIPVPW